MSRRVCQCSSISWNSEIALNSFGETRISNFGNSLGVVHVDIVLVEIGILSLKYRAESAPVRFCCSYCCCISTPPSCWTGIAACVSLADEVFGSILAADFNDITLKVDRAVVPFNAVPWAGLVGRKAFIVVVLNGSIGESHGSDVLPLVCVQSELGAAERGVFVGATGALEDFLGGRVCVVVPNCPVN